MCTKCMAYSLLRCMCKVCIIQSFFPWFLWAETVKQGLRFKHQLYKKFTYLPQESGKILRETQWSCGVEFSAGTVGTGHRTVFSEGQRVVVFVYQPLKLHHLSSPVQQVVPRQRGAKPGVETSWSLSDVSKALIDIGFLVA